MKQKNMSRLLQALLLIAGLLGAVFFFAVLPFYGRELVQCAPEYAARLRLIAYLAFADAVIFPVGMVVIALLGVIAFEGFQLFRGPTASESATQQKENDNQYLDINTLKGDPNDGDE